MVKRCSWELICCLVQSQPLDRNPSPLRKTLQAEPEEAFLNEDWEAACLDLQMSVRDDVRHWGLLPGA